ncbi:MAG: iron-containing alcohol dehydrogenase [Smithellaceae bacterium]|jgi:alcohol dehydrogenase
MSKFQFAIPTRIHFGSGEIEKVGQLVSRFGKKPIVVTGKSSMKQTGILEKIVNNLKQQKIESVIFDRVKPNPDCELIDQGASLAGKKNCDVVIGLGGGSAIDAAKCVAVAAANRMPIWECVNKKTFGLNKEVKEGIPLVAIPTTAGTGSEVDKFAVLTNQETKEKPGVGSPFFYPKLSIIDPQLTISLPRETTVFTGLDTFFHGIEALLSNRSSIMSDLFAESAVKLVVENLPIVKTDPNNVIAREKMAFASLMGGIAMDQAGNILIHAMEHPLSGHFDISHAEGLMALWQPVMEFIQGSDSGKTLKIAGMLGADLSNLSPEEIHFRVIREINNFFKIFNITLKEIAVTEDMIGKLCEDALNTMGYTIKGNPKPVGIQDIENIYRKALRIK